tara:strand:+ start:143 stop:325 length:183 start_codon:yes stop_codon:yes gene_type:complete
MKVIIEDPKGNQVCQFNAEIDNYYYEDGYNPLLNLENCKIVDRYKDHHGLHYIKVRIQSQ